jgi:hypothetical protein
MKEYNNFIKNPWFPETYGPLAELYRHEGIDPEDHQRAIDFLTAIVEQDMTVHEKEQLHRIKTYTHTDNPVKVKKYLEHFLAVVHQQNIATAMEKNSGKPVRMFDIQRP